MASTYLSNTAYGSFANGGGGYQSASQPTTNRDAFSAAATPMYQTASNFATPQGGSRIKVAVRIRPLLEHERGQGHECSKLKVQGTNEVAIVDESMGGNRQKAFRFDQVFTQATNQSDVYSGLGLSNLVNKVIEGYHGTIFAYGQTGSGKTFTMEGYDFMGGPGVTQSDFNGARRAVKASNTSENIGISQRCIYELYNQLAELRKHERTSGRHYQVFCSYLQIYNEKVFDLLNQNTLSLLGNKKSGNSESVAKQQQGLRIRWTKKDQFVVENLFVFECQSAEEALDLFRLGSKNRVLASHNLNDVSSRSHTIFCLTIESQDIAHQEMVTVSKLQLVDLAGSEKQSLTGTTGVQAKESIDINKSLLVLRKVITALTDQRGGPDANKMSFVPYRESKLTCLLKQSLGGNSYTLMVACLSPSDRFLEENLSTLNYAARASLISNIPTKNIDPRLLEIDDQKHKIHELEKELKNANNHIQYITQINDERGRRIGVLEAALKGLGKNVEEIYAQADINVESSTSKLPMIKKIDSSSSQSNNNIEKSTSTASTRQVMSPGKNPPPTASSNPANANQAKRTQMNFYLQQDKQKMDAASERLIHSVNAVTDLLKANTELRDTIEKMRRSKEDTDAEVFTLNIENQTLRERLELVEGILKNNRENYEQLVSDDVKGILAKSNTQYGKFNMNAPLEGSPAQQTDFTIDAVYTELIQLRQHNRALETRIKQLELQNFNITRGGFNPGPGGAKPATGGGGPVKNVEPNRPIFDGGQNNGQSEQEGEEDEYDDEYDEEYEDEEESALQGQSSFAVHLDSNQQQQVQNNKNLNFRRQMLPNQTPNEAQLQQLKSAGDQRSNQLRKDSQPIPDQRFYTKTNFFTLGQQDQDPNLSIADKYAHLHSQKMQRRPYQNAAAADFQGGDRQQQRGSFTEGKQILAGSAPVDPDFFNQNPAIRSTVKKAQQFIPMAEQLMEQQENEEFDSSNVLVKRKIKKRRIIQAPQMGQMQNGNDPMMMPSQQTNNNISMVMVMSNLMTKRKKQKKRTSNSMYQRKPQKYANNEFYF